jgi:hypothetical protein
MPLVQQLNTQAVLLGFLLGKPLNGCEAANILLSSQHRSHADIEIHPAPLHQPLVNPPQCFMALRKGDAGEGLVGDAIQSKLAVDADDFGGLCVAGKYPISLVNADDAFVQQFYKNLEPALLAGGAAE